MDRQISVYESLIELRIQNLGLYPKYQTYCNLVPNPLGQRMKGTPQ